MSEPSYLVKFVFPFLLGLAGSAAWGVFIFIFAGLVVALLGVCGFFT